MTDNLLNYLQQKQSENDSTDNSYSLAIYARIASYFRIYPLLSVFFVGYSEQQIRYSFNIFAASLNTFILIYQIVRFFLFQYSLINAYTTKILDVINSFFLKIYQNVFFFSFNAASFQAFSESSPYSSEIGLAIYTIFLTQVISLVQSLHDFSFSFILEDYMASIDSSSKQLEIFLSLTLVILFGSSGSMNQNVVCIFHIICVSIKIVFQLIELIYYDNTIIQTNLFFKIFHLLSSIAFCLSYNLPNYLNGNQLVLVLLILLPFSYIIATYLLAHRIQSLSLKERNYSSLSQLNLHIRTAFFMVKHLDMHDYTNLYRSVLYESIYENHYDTCRRSDCFCEQFLRENGFSWEELQGYKFRDKFVSQYFTQMYSDYLKQISKNKQKMKREYNQTCFNYLTFLIEVVNVPTSALVEVVQFENSERKSSSIKDQMIFQSIYNHGEHTFYNFFNNPTIYNQKLQLHKVIEFDYIFQKCQKSLKECLLQEREMLTTLCQEYVDIQKLGNTVKSISQLKTETLNMIKMMYQFNPYSRRSQQITYIYSESLDLQKRKPNSYLKQALLINRKLLNVNSHYDKNITLFSQDACVIYISLLNPIGIIKKASFTTRQVFGYHPSELLNKNCNMLIPDQLKQIHDGILQKFVTSGQLNGINAGELQIFGIKQNGFAVPLTMRIRLDQTQANDFGASAFFTFQNNSSEFLIFSTKGKMCNLTKKIYTQLLSKLIPEDVLKLTQKIDLYKMIPTLDIHFQSFQNKNQTLSTEHNSLLICPTSQKALKVLSYFSEQTFNSINDFLALARKLNIHDFKYYVTTYRIGKLATSYKGFALGFLQIEKVQLLKHKSDIKEHLKNVITEIEKTKQYLEIEQDFEKEAKGELSLLQKKDEHIEHPFEQILKEHQNQRNQQIKAEQKREGNQSNKSLNNNVQRRSIVSQVSRKAQVKQIDTNNTNTHIKSMNEIIKLTEPNQLDLSIQQNTNRKLVNIQIPSNQLDKFSHNDIKSDQSFDQYLNIITPVLSTKQHQNFNFDTKGLMSNEAIFEQNEQDEINIDHSDLLDSIFSSKSHQGETFVDSFENQSNHDKNEHNQENNNKIPIEQNAKKKMEQSVLNQVKVAQNKVDHQQTQSNTPEGDSNFFRQRQNTVKDQSKTGGATKIQILDQNKSSSVNSGQSEYHSIKNILLVAVSKSHQSKTMKFLYFAGFISIFVLIILISTLFTIQHNFFQYSNTLNSNIVKGYEIMEIFNSIIAHTEYIKMYTKGVIPNTLNTTQVNLMKKMPLIYQQQFKDAASHFENQDRGTWYGQYIRDNYEGLVVWNQRNISSILTLKQIYSFIAMAQNLYMYSQKMTEVYLRYIHYNQKNVLSLFQSISDLQKQEMDYEMDKMRNFQVLSIVLLEIFTVVMAFQILPIFYYIQTKREEILKLFCTFQISQLKDKIRQCEYFANQDVLHGHNSTTLFNREIHNMKKRTSSTTNNLQKINLNLIVLASLVFGFFSLYPIINYVLTNNYINNYSFSSKELSVIYSLRGKAPLMFTLNFLRQTATYEERPQSLLDGLDGQLTDTYSFISTTITDLVTLLKDSSQQNSMYDSNLNTQIIENMMNTQLCDPLSTYQTTYLDTEDLIDLTGCKTLLNGVWGNGYLLGLQTLLGVFKDFQELYQVSYATNDKYVAALTNLYSKDNGAQFLQVYYYVSQVPKLIGNFILNQSNSFYNSQILYSLAIFIFVIVLAVITFLILWNMYYSYLRNLIYSTRQIYGLFSYDFIHNNPFISNYVKKEYSS